MHGSKGTRGGSRSWDVLAGVALVVAIALWVGSAFGLDPTNIPQLQDFQTFHLPSIKVFAERPFGIAIADYPAAPFPLFYMLAGLLYRATGSVTLLRVWSVGLGLLLLWTVFALARSKDTGQRRNTWLLVAIVITSPYFRGQTVYANTDILALLFAFTAIYSFSSKEGRHTVPVLALALAFLAFYTRQFYVFVPAYLLLAIITGSSSSTKMRVQTLAVAAALSVPAVALVSLWGSVTPPRFAQHERVPALTGSIPVVVLLLSFYALPQAVVTISKFRQAAAEDLRKPIVWLMALPFVALGLYLLFRGADIPDVVGGGIPIHALKSVSFSSTSRAVILALAVAVGGTYLAYLIQQDLRRNCIVFLIFACFAPTHILYQRYFDPILPLVYCAVISTRENSTRGLALGLACSFALEIFISAVGLGHYATVFRT